MPDATHYRWSDLPADRPMDLLERRRFHGQHMTVARVVLQKGCVVPTHTHENEQVSICLSGRLRMGLGAENTERREVMLVPGEALHLPAGVAHSAVAEEETVSWPPAFLSTLRASSSCPSRPASN